MYTEPYYKYKRQMYRENMCEKKVLCEIISYKWMPFFPLEYYI